MNAKLQLLIQQMNDKNWVRMVVCFFPGIVLGKVFAQLNAPELLQTAATVLLLLGAFIWMFWSKIKKRLLDAAGGQDAVFSDDECIKELQSRCQMNNEDWEKLIFLEMKLNPTLNYSQALDLALQRKRLQ